MIHYLKRKQKLRKYEEKLLDSDCPRITNCTSAPILGHIYYVYIPKYQSYYLWNCIKEFVGVTQEKDLCLTEPSPKNIGGRVYRRKPKSMSRNVINAKGWLQISTNRVGPLILSLVLSRLLNKAWISQALFLKQQEIRDAYRSAQTISPNGSKPSPWPTIGMWILTSLSGRTLLLNLRSLIPSSQITAFNLIARPSRDTAVTWELQIGIPLLPTPKEMDRLRLLTMSQSMG